MPGWLMWILLWIFIATLIWGGYYLYLWCTADRRKQRARVCIEQQTLTFKLPGGGGSPSPAAAGSSTAPSGRHALMEPPAPAGEQRRCTSTKRPHATRSRTPSSSRRTS
jgi:hypothetical protein